MHIGILGYGQLGRMLAMAGLPLGFRFSFYDTRTTSLFRTLCPADGPAVTGDKAFARFMEDVQRVTFETENTPEVLINAVSSQQVSVCPNKNALLTAQNRIQEKTFCQTLSIPTTPFRAVHTLADAQEAADVLGLPMLLKTVTMGYDGKGQYKVSTHDEINKAWEALNSEQLIAEQWVAYDEECAMIAVRDAAGEERFYPLVRTYHKEGILHQAIVSQTVHPRQAEAEKIASQLLDTLQYVGVLTIEFFNTSEGLLVNEIAPRVHNSGHWSIEGAATSQFENHIRAITGLPLGETMLRAPYIGLHNLIGHEGDIEQALALPDVHVHLYGKTPRPGRKLGHITVLADSEEALQSKLMHLSSE